LADSRNIVARLKLIGPPVGRVTAAKP
jgi:hypothetical protein